MQITFDEKKRLDTNPIFHLFVQGENMAESIRIVGPKMVGALDLSQLRMAVRVTSAAYETMVEKTLEQTVSDEGTITLVWNVDRQFTSNPGHVQVMLVGYGNNEEVIKITSSGIEVKEDETFISAPQGNTWEQILREMQDLATQAKNSQTAAAASATSATASEQVAIYKAEQTAANAKAADTSATLSESWAVGGTGTREGEDTNNAQYWAEQAQQVSQGALGWYETEQALQTAHPTGENGQWAIIGSTDTIWTWDSDTSAWVNSGAQVDLSNYYTKAQADAAFATAAQGTLASSAVQSVNGLPGPNPSLTAANVGAAPAANGISTYTCTTSGTTHALTGTGDNIRFVADAAYNEGDTITVNGQAVTAQTQDGAALVAGAWASGATVVCWLNGTVLTVSWGGNGGSPISQNAVLFSVSKSLSQQQVSDTVQSPKIVIEEGSFIKQNAETSLRISASTILKGSSFVFGVGVLIDNNFYAITRSNIQDFLFHAGSLVVNGVSAGEHTFQFVAYGRGNAGTTMTVTTASYQIASMDCMEVA